MRYFSVEKEVMDGMVSAAEVSSDGDFIEVPNDREGRHIVTGFSVFEYNDLGMTEKVEFYPVKTNFTDWTDDADEVLEKIKKIYAAPSWQNNAW